MEYEDFDNKSSKDRTKNINMDKRFQLLKLKTIFMMEYLKQCTYNKGAIIF